MTLDEKKEHIIQSTAEMMRRFGFSVEYKITKKPKGVRIIYEVTREQMDALLQNTKEQMREGGENRHLSATP